MKPTSRARETEADRADIYALYEESVQSPEDECASLSGIFQRRRGRRARLLREDFCGSAALSMAWIKSGADRRAIAIDLDPEVLAYAYLHHARPLGRAADRLELRRQNVLDSTRDRADAICAYNFSYFVFKKRRELASYFRAAREGLARDGMLFLDIFGGITAQQTSIETRDVDTFEYLWEQERYDPLTNELLAHIHFRFRDQSMITKAFTYDWRLWTFVELRELLEECGFASVEFHFEDRTPSGEHTGRYRRRTRIDNEPSWNAYVIAAL